MVFPTFFNSVVFKEIKSSWSENSYLLILFPLAVYSSPSLASKNKINLVLELTIWWCPCVELPLLLLEEGFCYDQCLLLAKLLSFALLHFVLQGQTCLILQVSLDFLLLHFNPLWWKWFFFFLKLVLRGAVGLHRMVNFIFFSINGWGIDLDYCGIEWFVF